MPRRFKVGDRVTWNSEAGRVSGKIVKVHTKDVNYKGYVHHASKDEPQYEIKSDKTDHVALHKEGALRLMRRRCPHRTALAHQSAIQSRCPARNASPFPDWIRAHRRARRLARENARGCAGSERVLAKPELS